MLYALIPKQGPFAILLSATSEAGLDGLIDAELARRNGINRGHPNDKREPMTREEFLQSYNRVGITITDLDGYDA